MDASGGPAALCLLTTEQRAAGMRASILQSCFFALAFLLFSNGFFILYFTALGLSRESTLLFLATPNLLAALLILPSAWLADRYGKKRVAWAKFPLSVGGFLALCGAAFLPHPWRGVAICGGVVAYAVASAVYNAVWFALLSPIVPEEARGRFFGRLRVSWQITGLAFGGVCSLLLRNDTPLWIFQTCLLSATVGLVLRHVFFRRIPEVEKPDRRHGSLLEGLARVLQARDYLPFCCYVFLLTLFTAASPSVFGLIEKKVLLLGDRQVIWLGNLTMIGSVLGYIAGGRAVDRYGTKIVFLCCHLAYGAVLALYLLRSGIPGLTVPVIGALHLCYGFVLACSSVSISSEMLALIPSEGKSMATSLCVSLTMGGSALAGVLSAGALRLGMLSENWRVFGLSMSAYDTILAACSVMVVLLVVALGLVPSVVRKSEWFHKAE